MAKGSTNKVARAAAAGRGRRANTKQRSLLFPVSMGLVVILGIVLIVVSRDDNLGEAAVSPTIGEHWHAAYGIYACDTFLPPLTDRADVALHNIHTHGDGLIHIHPASSAAAGNRALLDVFADTTGLKLSADSIEYPGMDKLTNGDDCGGEPGMVQLAYWNPTTRNAAGQPTAWDDEPTFFAGDPSDFKPEDDQLVTIAFAPEGSEIPQPSSVGALAAPADETPPPGATPIPTPTTAGDGAEPTDSDTDGEGDTTETTAADAESGDADAEDESGTTDTTAGP